MSTNDRFKEIMEKVNSSSDKIQLSPEATYIIAFCRQSSVVMVHKITAGISISLGNLDPKREDNLYNDTWILYPRVLCSRECFEELRSAGLLIHIVERWHTHREEVYVVKPE